jgi:membrane-associated protein
MLHLLNLTALIIGAGYIGLTAAVFFESGTIVGFFLPGDSLLFTAGLLASSGLFSIQLLILFLIPAAILGDIVGYATGKALGPRLFNNPQSRFFKPRYLEEAHAFFVRYGARAIFFARFVPMIRFFVPMVAGSAAMPYRGFLFYNILGGIIWAGLMPLLGYFLGRSIPNAEHYLLPITLLIIFLSFIPVFVHAAQSYARRKAALRAE